MFVLVLALIACVYSHVTVIGGTGPGPNAGDFFKLDAKKPCPIPSMDSNRVNVTAGTPFPVSWSLWANHNNPPNLNGFVQFFWITGYSNNGSKVEIVPKVVVSTQPTNYYFTQTVVINPGDANGRGTLQILYDVNGQSSPFPAYYQCIDFFVGM
jgi:hypothetical protein